jgi:hypothetical protein
VVTFVLPFAVITIQESGAMFLDDVCDSSFSSSGEVIPMACYYWLGAVTLPFAERGSQPELPLVNSFSESY